MILRRESSKSPHLEEKSADNLRPFTVGQTYLGFRLLQLVGVSLPISLHWSHQMVVDRLSRPRLCRGRSRRSGYCHES
jgi:hypothetical protein